MDKLKILMLNYEFPPIGGGGANANYHILKEFASYKNLNIDLLTSSPSKSNVTETFSDNITIYKVGIRKKELHYWRRREVIEWLIKATFVYRRLLQNNNYVLAHAFFGFPTGWLCYKTAKKLPYIISLRGSDVPGYNIRLGLEYKLTSHLFRSIWNNASMVVANSKGLKNLANRFQPNIDIKVIPNGVDTNKFSPNHKSKLEDKIRLLTVSRLITRKRIDLLIKAARKTVEKGLDIELNIAGRGNLTEQLKNLAAKLKITDKVHFLGRIESEKMPEVYKENDIFVMSSAHEGMCNAMLEAMASGLPIVTTKCEGVEELIGDNGIIIQNDDPQNLAEAVARLKQNTDEYQNMALAARERALKFSWKSVAREYYSLYLKLKK